MQRSCHKVKNCATSQTINKYFYNLLKLKIQFNINVCQPLDKVMEGVKRNGN